MSAAPQRGRRRAQPERRPSPFGPASARTGTRAGSPKSSVPRSAKYLAAMAVAGALVATGAVAQQLEPAGSMSLANLVSTTQIAPQPVSAPDDAAISFSGPSLSTAPKPAKTALTAEGNIDRSVPLVSAPVDDPAAAKAYAASQLAGFGWGADQMSCLTQLWQRESDWLTSAENPSTGAYGIVQSLPANKMESAGGDWATNYETQIRWGLGYIQGRYGSPCAAWGHSNDVGWY